MSERLRREEENITIAGFRRYESIGAYCTMEALLCNVHVHRVAGVN